MIRQKNNAGTWDEKKKSKTKQNNKIRGNKSESIDKRKKIKNLLSQDKAIQTRQDFSNTTKKFYQQLGRECRNTEPQPDNKETKQFLSKTYERRKQQKN